MNDVFKMAVSGLTNGAWESDAQIRRIRVGARRHLSSLDISNFRHTLQPLQDGIFGGDS